MTDNYSLSTQKINYKKRENPKRSVNREYTTPVIAVWGYLC